RGVGRVAQLLVYKKRGRSRGVRRDSFRRRRRRGGRAPRGNRLRRCPVRVAHNEPLTVSRRSFGGRTQQPEAAERGDGASKPCLTQLLKRPRPPGRTRRPNCSTRASGASSSLTTRMP